MKGAHAIVIGGSMAGLSAARVLSDSFDRVTVIDRDAYPEGAIERPGVPQSRHVHALLARGRNELNRLFLGFDQAMLAGGANDLDFAWSFATLRPSGWAPRAKNNLPLFFASRTLIESVIRRLLRQRGNVTLVERTAVTDLIATRQGDLRATGVQITPLDGGTSSELQADLIVDASGRSSKAPEWFQTLGLTPPEETIVDSFSGYSSRWFKAPDPSALPHDWWWQGVWIDIKLPENTLAGVLFPVEGGRWLITIAGSGKNYPPTDEAGFMAALHQLRSPIMGEMVRFAEPISPVYNYRGMANRFRHYESWPERLDGFIALGDSTCAFNPVYGQGMTTGTVSATILGECLSKYGPTHPDLPRQFFQAQAKFQQIPWGLATGADFRFPATTGKRPRVSHLISPYLETLFRAGDDDAVIRKQTGHVLNLLKMPSALFAPHITARVIRWWLQQKLSGNNGAGRPASSLPPALTSAG
jgi:2-polyprenyl-6-methoxyphenol hydroxylase-like FAD-dependent oxidoreductase